MVRARLEKEKEGLASALTLVRAEKIDLQEANLHLEQSLEETKGLVKAADERAEAAVAKANSSLRRINIAYYYQGYGDGKAGVVPLFPAEEMASSPPEDDDEDDQGPDYVPPSSSGKDGDHDP